MATEERSYGAGLRTVPVFVVEAPVTLGGVVAQGQAKGGSGTVICQKMP